MRKNFSLKAAFVAAVVFGSLVFSSCSKQKEVASAPQFVEVPGPTQYVDKEVERIIDNVLVAQTLEDRTEFLYNGQIALTAQVTPDSLCLTLPVAEHTASTIKGDNNSWSDSHGMGFTGVINLYPQEGLTLNPYIEPADPFSTTKSIHPKVTWLKGKFLLKGMATDEKSGKSNTFSIPVPTGSYFMCDSTVDVRKITETKYEIVHDTTYIRNDSIITEKVYEYVDVVKDAAVFNGFGFGKIDFTYGEKSFSFRFDLDSTLIHREESEWGIAKLTDENAKGFTLSDKQAGKYSIKENGITLKSVNFSGEAASFKKLTDLFKNGTATVKVVVSYEDKSGQPATREFLVSGYYLHELVKAQAQPEPNNDDDPVVIEPSHTYDVDTVRVDVKDSEGNLTGQKMRVTIKKDGESWYKAQYMIWETGLASPTLTGTQVGDNEMLRPTSYGKPEEFHAEGWWGTENLKGATTTAYSLQYKFRTAFKAVPGFGQAEESVAETNLIFGKRDFHITDAETGWELSIPAGDLSVTITEDFVGSDEQAKAEVNGRGLEYEYIGTHYLSFDQYVGGVKVTSQSRAENLLYPKN